MIVHGAIVCGVGPGVWSGIAGPCREAPAIHEVIAVVSGVPIGAALLALPGGAGDGRPRRDLGGAGSGVWGALLALAGRHRR
jgi:hypothetical protein